MTHMLRIQDKKLIIILFNVLRALMQKINNKQKQMENQLTDINSTKSEQGNTESQNHCSKI